MPTPEAAPATSDAATAKPGQTMAQKALQAAFAVLAAAALWVMGYTAYKAQQAAAAAEAEAEAARQAALPPGEPL